ncbi:MAG: hypothetical protein FJ149_02005 [Euryarchaeota archaeon]|nr:hypothetical protein [Euryarchaeota archaeon]
MKGKRTATAARGRAGRARRADRRTGEAAVRTLDERLATLATEEVRGARERLDERTHAHIARELLDVFFNIWIRFAVDLGRELRMSPWQWDFVIYGGGKSYRFREGFNFARLNEVTLEESAPPFRHTLKGELSTLAGRPFVRVSFVLEEGRTFGSSEAVTARSSYLIYNEPAARFGVHRLKESLSEPLRAWIRSEVRGDPALLWDLCHEKLRRGR